jgi:hypothetical protein
MKGRFAIPVIVGLVTTMALLLPGTATAVGSDPKPIPGGIQVPEGPFIHVFLPGPVELGLMGENVEPSVITDFNGFTGLAYINGTATDADGNSYTLATDIRVFQGTYVSEDGTALFGTFALI